MMQVASMLAPVRAVRLRSSLARRVTDTLEKFYRQGEFRQLQLGRLRVGRMTHRVLWHHDRSYRFVLDVDAGAVIFPSLLPATLPPQLLRDLRCFLRPDGGIEREFGELRVFVQHGALTLSVTVTNDAYEYCTSHLVRLADRVLSSFLEQPAYDAYRIHSLTRAAAAME
ncbi:MAG TPA: hypothetical protein VNR40_04835 [Steroidobacter sp.]|nr:hypothetical protein [Steroidobacter sp.]